MTNRDVIRRFVKGDTGAVRNVRSTAHTNVGDVTHVLWSYDEPIAIRMSDGTILKSSHNYTQTTSEHMRELRCAIAGWGHYEPGLTWVQDRGETPSATKDRRELRDRLGLPLTGPGVVRRGRFTYSVTGARLRMGDGGPEPNLSRVGR